MEEELIVPIFMDVSKTQEQKTGRRARKVHITMRLDKDVLTKIEELRGTYIIEGWSENPYFKKNRTFVINTLLRKALES